MRITQGYVSKSVSDFPFLKQMELTEYLDSGRPVVFFGCYSEEDLQIIINHNGKKVIFWCGQDAIDCIFFGRYQFLQDCIHVSHLVNVVKALSAFLKIKLINPIYLGGKFSITPKAKKVFAYAPDSFPKYHNIGLIRAIQKRIPEEYGIQLLYGDGSVSQKDWLKGVGDAYYYGCFIGLVLSGFAGGGQTVIQMGMKGIKVVTNVVDLPNVINWKSIDDVVHAISNEYIRIGENNEGLSISVKESLNSGDWLDL